MRHRSSARVGLGIALGLGIGMGGAGATLGGCATMITGNAQIVTLTSEPPGATVRLDGAPLGQTPLQVSLLRWDSGVLSFELAGHHPASIALTKSVNPVVVLDLPWFLLGIFPGFVAVGVDVATGAVFELHPGYHAVVLTPIDSGPEAAGPAAAAPPTEGTGPPTASPGEAPEPRAGAADGAPPAAEPEGEVPGGPVP